MHHWTDSKIRVHVFTCVLALATALDHLAGIGETVLLHHDGGKGRPAPSASSPT